MSGGRLCGRCAGEIIFGVLCLASRWPSTWLFHLLLSPLVPCLSSQKKCTQRFLHFGTVEKDENFLQAHDAPRHLPSAFEFRIMMHHLFSTLPDSTADFVDVSEFFLPFSFFRQKCFGSPVTECIFHPLSTSPSVLSASVSQPLIFEGVVVCPCVCKDVSSQLRFIFPQGRIFSSFLCVLD